MDFNYKNKTVLVTGGASGIGLEIANRFFELGANIILCGRDSMKFESAKSKITNQNPNSKGVVLTYQCNMSDEESVNKMVTSVKNHFSHINILVNNCSTWFSSPIINLNTKELDEAYCNILKSTIISTKNFAQFMENNEGYNSIINISSFAGTMPQKHASIYACLKAAIINFTKSAASELIDLGIRVNCITPGVIDTDMTNDYIKTNNKKLLNPISMGRFGEMEDVANLVSFLCSRYANYINGENIFITGGKYIVQN